MGAPGAARAPATSARLLVVVFILFVAVRLANLTTFCLDSDEVFSVRVARAPWPAMLDAVARDAVHPPLFYAVLKCWIGIGGESRLWLRWLPFLFSLAAAPLFLLLCRRLTAKPSVTTLAFLFLAVNPYQVFHSQYVRMYSLAFLLSLCSILAFDSVVRGARAATRDSVWLTLSNLALVYTHYFGWLLVGAELAYTALYRRERAAAVAAASGAVALCSAPWIWSAANAALAKGGLAANLGWIVRPGLAEFFWHFAGLNGPIRPYALSIALIAPFIAVLIIGLRRAWRDPRNRDSLRIALMLALAPPVAAFVVSHVAPYAIWESRYLVIAAAPYFVLLAIAVDALELRAQRIVRVAVTAFLLYGAVQLSFRPEPRVDIEAVAQRIAEAPAPVYSFDRPLAYTLQYFIDQRGHARVAPARDPGAIHHNPCWIVTTNHCCREIPAPAAALRERGYRSEQRFVVHDEWNEITAVRMSLEKKTAPAEP